MEETLHKDAKIFKLRCTYDLIHSFIFPNDTNDWLECPICHAKPKVWIFDNGRTASCKCHNTTYDHFSIHAQSIMSHYKNDGNTANYNPHELKENWNHWVKTGEILFQHAGKRTDGRW